MYEKFTERARKVMSLARQESLRLNSDAIKTEHVLLGIVKEAGGVAAKVLKNLVGNLDLVQQVVERFISPIPTSPTAMLGQLPISTEVKQTITLAEESAREMTSSMIGTEHLLLGMFKENTGIAAQALGNLGLKFDEVQAVVFQVLGVLKGVQEVALKDSVVKEPAQAPTNDKWIYQKMGTVEVLLKDSEASSPSTLTIWKMLWESRFTDFYAVGRTQETAIIIRAWDWEMVRSMINTDSEQYAKFR